MAPLPPRRRLLIVDDEPNLLRTFAMVMPPEFEVHLAQGGLAALALLDRDRAFDAVLCDLQMPEVDGIDVHARALALDPALARRFIFTTGGVFQPRVQDFLQRSRATVLEKPFTVESLVAVMDRVGGR